MSAALGRFDGGQVRARIIRTRVNAALAVLPPSAPDGCPTIHASAAARRDLLPFVRQALAGPAATPQH